MKRRHMLLIVLCLVVGTVGIAAAQLPVPTPVHDVAVSVSVFPPVVAPGGTVTVSGSVWNEGNVDEVVMVRIATRVAGRTLVRTVTVPLPIEGSVTQSRTFRIPLRAPAGLYPVGAAATIVGATDSNLTNNADYAYVKVSP
jgi:hypothetical protein